MLLASFPLNTPQSSFDLGCRSSILFDTLIPSNYDEFNINFEDPVPMNTDFTPHALPSQPHQDTSTHSSDESQDSNVTDVINELEDAFREQNPEEETKPPPTKLSYDSMPHPDQLYSLLKQEQILQTLSPSQEIALEQSTNSSNAPPLMSSLFPGSNCSNSITSNSNQGFVPLAPAPSPTSLSVSQSKLGYEDPRIRKMQLRKERNRESARRSSMKRSAMLRKLKKDIADMKEREVQLRKLDEKLRRENTALRAALYNGHQ